ncbi:hypothetical protein BpHYR1_008585 [Brachionus plicatilis]|uniref:Uncharacterized protein n=1 Tax=Brachionus plicatilis TaxID=10195 RepID=A0A3M7PMG4_BRAPC|nr:hypothetical protein BpHYR1_008585 [Brachionus plicatilis]
MASKMADLTLQLYRSPRIRIKGPVMAMTLDLRDSPSDNLMHSQRIWADCSLMSGEPFKRPSLNIGRMQEMPFLARQNPGKCMNSSD